MVNGRIRRVGTSATAHVPSRCWRLTTLVRITVSTKAWNQRDSRCNPMVARLCRFLAARRRRRSSPLARWANLASRWTVRGISNGGDPSRPTPSRTGPSIGTMTLVARRQLSAVLLWEG
jgi:hypothetical protein